MSRGTRPLHVSRVNGREPGPRREVRLKPTMAARIRALQEMTVLELRAEYQTTFGEETRSRHKEFLWKQVAWRLQANEEGDLSERARQRAAELANTADARLRAPSGAFGVGTPPAPGRTRVHDFRGPQDTRLPMAGTVLTREYRGRQIRVTVLDHGFEHDGKVHRSLSALAQEVTGSHWNGFHFFGLRAGGGTR